jgi:hypothetical protein
MTTDNDQRATLYTFDVSALPHHRTEQTLTGEEISRREIALVFDHGATLINSNAARREYATRTRRWVLEFSA